jgi:signal transduction histidine kinase/FixJ family two-component response regulator
VGSEIRILYIEDEPRLARLVQRQLALEGCRVDVAETARDGLERCDPEQHDLVMVDYNLPDATGLTVLEELVRRAPGLPVVVVTGAGSEQLAVQAMKLGAADYIVKESSEQFFALLPPVIGKAVQQRRLLREKQRAEEDLRASEERMRSILRSMDDLVLVIDRDGRFLDIRAPEESPVSPSWIGRRFAEVLPAQGVRCLDEAIAAVERGGARGQFDCALGDAWYDAKVSPLKDAAGGFSGVTVVARDITVRRRDEESLRRAKQEAEAASRAKSELLAGMSHELRTPLTAIIGYAEILLYEYFGPVNERQRQQLDIVLRCSHHLLELINDILDIAKIEAGRVELEYGTVDLGALAQHSLVLMRETAARRRIRLDARVDGDAPVTLAADERRVKQVLFNLLSNAIKFTPEGGSVELSVRRAGAEAEVTVTDTGIGIPEGERERIFESFYQIKRPGAEKVAGSGLGLALVRQIVELHGGAIRAESDGEGLGSRFIFTLPLAPAKEAPGRS